MLKKEFRNHPCQSICEGVTAQEIELGWRLCNEVVDVDGRTLPYPPQPQLPSLARACLQGGMQILVKIMT